MADRRLVLPSQTATASAEDIARALELRDQVVALAQNRGAYIAANQVDPGFANADGGWSQPIMARLFNKVALCDHETIANLRANCMIFSGYSLYEVRGAAGLGMIEDFGLYTDAVVAQNLEDRNHEFVGRWLLTTRDLPVRCLFSPPHRFGEIGEEKKGIIVNYDTLVYQGRINLLYDAGVLGWLDELIARRSKIRILEIGGGYGALASWFKAAYPECSYTIVDLPESLIFSSLYLGLSRPDLACGFGVNAVPYGFRFVPNYMAEQLDEEFDLVINTLSMSEMSELQVRRYAEIIAKRWTANGGFFFEQNQDNREQGWLFAQNIIAEYFPERIWTTGRAELSGFGNLWAMHKLVLAPPPSRATQAILVAAIGERNVIYDGRRFYAVVPSLGDWGSDDLAALPGVIVAETLAEIRDLCRQANPVQAMERTTAAGSGERDYRPLLRRLSGLPGRIAGQLARPSRGQAPDATDTARLSLSESIARSGEIELLPLLRTTSIGRRVGLGYALSRRDKPGHALYGPYQPLKAGHYRLEVRAIAKRAQSPQQPALVVEVVTGGDSVLVTRNLSARDLSGRVLLEFWVPSEFAVDGSAPATFEFRVFHPATTDLTINSIVLRAIEPPGAGLQGSG